MQVTYRNQNGAALIVGLVLLMVLTVLGISGMNTASLELSMAGNKQYGETAFQLAETAIERSMSVGAFSTAIPSALARTCLPGTRDQECYEATTTFDIETQVPTGGFSIGVGAGFQAYHFDVEAEAGSFRGAQADHTQSFYVIGPGSE